MLSFVRIYSKFTSEFLLLISSAMFALLAVYIYHWVIKRRRLGTAGKQVPAELVRAYLNQMINEAKFVRTQLFGVLSNMNEASDLNAFKGLMQPGVGSNAAQYSATPSAGGSGNISEELNERLKALESQLSEKEGYIVNINVEKTKLLKEIEALKEAGKNGAPVAAGGNNDDLLKKLKQLELQLAEYAMFEDDLANIKRIKQENDSLKQKIQDLSSNAPSPTIASPSTPVAAEPAPAVALAAVPEATVSISEPEVELASQNSGPALDQAAIDALLQGEPAVPPVIPTEAAPEPEPMIAKAVGAEDFDALAKSVESSVAATPIQPDAPTASANLASAESPASAETKSDEDLLKEFENLLNS